MKKILALILILATLLSFAACSDSKYEPVESTDEEARIMMIFEFEGEKYEMRYELYRALFLNFSEAYDGGDKSFWETDSAASAINAINERIISFSADIFAAIHLCKKIGYDPYSSDADEKIEKYIENSVDGNLDEGIEGFGGDYGAYLEFLKKNNLNYSVQTLLFRYAIAYDKIVEYYTGTVDSENPTADMQDGALEYSKDDVTAFYNNDDSARVSIIVMSPHLSEQTIKEKRDKIASYDNENDALNYAVSCTLSGGEDIFNGTLIGKNSLDSAYYAEVTQSAFALGIGETSEPIKVTTDKDSQYWILYKMEKTEDFLENSFSSVENVYVSQKIGEIIENVKNAIIASKAETESFASLKHSEISMQ